MHHIIFLLTLLCLTATLAAQNVAPALPQAKPVAITGVTAHLGNGQVLENATIAFANGKITQVGAAAAAPSGHDVIDGSGKHVYPGFIATNTSLGLVEIGNFKATQDYEEVGDFNPNVRSLIAYNTDSQVIPTVRSRGTLLAQPTPTGGLVAGYSSVVQLDAWNWEDAAVGADDGLHVYWPQRMRFSFRTFALEQNESYQKNIDELKLFLREAAAFCQQAKPSETNLRLQGMCPVLSGKKPVYVHVDQARDIEQAILLAKEYNLKLVIVGGRDSYMLTDLLRDNGVSVILGQMHSLPAYNDTDVDQPFKTPAQLHAAGVPFAISSEGFWQQRNLAFQAGTAVAYGLPYEQAVQALTLAPARILGIADRYGSLEVGKSATLFLCNGDALDMRGSRVERAFIDGRDVDLTNKQDRLYEKYKEKYSRQEGPAEKATSAEGQD